MEKLAAQPAARPRGISPGLLAATCLIAFAVTVAVVVQPSLPEGVALALTLLMDLPLALAIFAAAGGWGHLAFRRLLPPDTPAGLAAITSVALGLWLLATALLAAGALVPGALSGILWWPVIILGVALALWAARRPLAGARLPARLPVEALLVLLLAVAAGFWAAGATVPQGYIGRGNNSGDFYDVVSYHLQVPREFYEAGRIGFLPHNTYSNYPLGGEMLFLLGMILRGGAFAGAFTATFTHGLWGALAVAALWTALPAASPWRQRAAGILAATAPIAIYVGWLAFVELSELAYLALAIAWLMQWRSRPGARSAVLVGLLCGGACATKYLSLGLVAAPVLAVMLAMAAASRPPRALRHWLLACLLCLLPLAPWLVRNIVNTGNPVFPLATGLLGRAHWLPESTARWNAAHAAPAWADKPAHLAAAAGDVHGFGVALPVGALLAAVWILVRWRRAAPLDRACLGIGLLQVILWSLATHMPTRFLIPAIVPMAILAGGLLARLAPLPGGAGQPSRWRTALAAAVLLTSTVPNYLQSQHAYILEGEALLMDRPSLHGLRTDQVAKLSSSPVLQRALEATPNSRLLEVGDVRPFMFPANTVYVSVWEMDPLVRLARQTDDPHEILRRLRQEYGITHLWVHWVEIGRLRRTYGWWDEITPAFIDSLIAAGATAIDLDSGEYRVPRLPDGRLAIQFLAVPEERR
jgi:hypothetical protein